MTYEEKLALIATVEKNRTLMMNLYRRRMDEKADYLLRKYGLVGEAKAKAKAEAEAKTKESKKRQEVAGSKEPPEARSQKPEASEKLRVIRTGREVNYDELPPELKRRWDENRDNYKLIRSLHEKLKLMHKAPDTMREPLCKEIVSRDEKIRDNWKAVDEWDGTYPEPVTRNPEPGTQLDFKRINSNRKYISVNMAKATTDATFRANVQERYNELKAAGIEMKPETLAELTANGIEI